MDSNDAANPLEGVGDATVHETNGTHPVNPLWKDNPDGLTGDPLGDMTVSEARLLAILKSITTTPEPPRTTEDTADIKNVAKHRRWIGYGLAAFTVVAVTWTAYRSHNLIAAIPAPAAGQPPTFASASVIAHAIVTAAFISFCIVLMRIAERLFMPYWWANKTKNIGLLLGHRGMSEKRYLEILKEILATVRGTKE